MFPCLGGEMRATVMAFKIQKYLGGLHYPARKPQIVERARTLGADAHVMRALLGLPDRVYESPIVLSCEVGRQLGA